MFFSHLLRLQNRLTQNTLEIHPYTHCQERSSNQQPALLLMKSLSDRSGWIDPNINNIDNKVSIGIGSILA